MTVDASAHRLSGRIDDLATSLVRAGAPGAASARLLELAAVAAMHAVSLDALSSAPPERPRPLVTGAAATRPS